MMESLVKLQLHLVKELSSPDLTQLSVIPWASPVPYFGDILSSRVATVGINPSNLEFADHANDELTGSRRRFPTLQSLKLKTWGEADNAHARECVCSCLQYFERNPYNGWFGSLDRILGSTGYSYYSNIFPACHLDLVPFATSVKWTELKSNQKSRLLGQASSLVRKLLAVSAVDLVILNGRTVVDVFESQMGIKFEKALMEEWELSRQNTGSVPGLSFRGQLMIERAGREAKSVTVVGFNHNIQSSFGIAGSVRQAIQAWVGTVARTVYDQA